MDFLGAPHNSDQQILTLTLPQFKFALFVPLENPNNQSVKFVFDELERMLGNDFSRVFEVILTDRDSKFNCFKEIEVNALGEIRSHVFFCNPGASNEKPNIENFNSQIRATFNKGIHLSNITWKQCNIISSNYNSRFLNSIDGKRPLDLFIECFGEEIIKKLDLKIIEPNEVKILNFKKY